MKRCFKIITLAVLCTTLLGCSSKTEYTQISATTLPVYSFTEYLCRGTGIHVTRLIDQDVSCLHDYTLQVSQMKAIEASDIIVISGAGLEGFMDETMLSANNIIDASEGVPLQCAQKGHDHENDHDHAHDHDPHIWLSPDNASLMAENIYRGLLAQYPEYEAIFQTNYAALTSDINDLKEYGHAQLSSLSSRKLITFHDGFSYMAEAFDLEIVHTVEEESGSEASANELIVLTSIVTQHDISAIFTEKNGSTSAATVISAETGVAVYQLDMAMSGDSYFNAMYHNIDTLREALQ